MPTCCMHEIEAQLLKDAYAVFLDELSSETIFDEAYFRSLHRRTFESLYATRLGFAGLNPTLWPEQIDISFPSR